MEAAWIARARWRWRGAWLWPTFVVAAFLDGVIAVVRPSSATARAWPAGCWRASSSTCSRCCSSRAGWARPLRRVRGDMPVGVARNYGGTIAVALVSAALLAVGAGAPRGHRRQPAGAARRDRARGGLHRRSRPPGLPRQRATDGHLHDPGGHGVPDLRPQPVTAGAPTA